MSAQIRFPADALAAALSIAAAFIVRPEATAVDARLPLIAGVVAVLMYATVGPGRRLAEVLPLLLVVAAVGIASDPLRLLAYGVITSAAFALAVSSRLDEGRLALFDATLLLAAFLLLLLGIPQFDFAVRSVLLAVGSGVLLWAGSRDASVTPAWLSLVAVAAAVTPVVPGRASLFPLLLALGLRAIWSRSLPLAIPAIVLGIVIGPWTAAVWGAIVIALVLKRRPDAEHAVAVPGAPGGMVTALLPPVAMFPGALLAFARIDIPLFAAAAVLAAGALLTRPAVGLLHGIALVALLLAPREERAPAAGVITAALAAGAVALVPWSGALYPFLVFWPAPATLVATVLALAAFAALVRSSAAISILCAAASVLALLFAPAPLTREPVERSIARGEETFIKPGRLAPRVDVILSGAGMATVGPDMRIGTVTALEPSGRAFTREIFGRDLADWAAFRRDQRFGSRNAIPLRPAPRLAGFGHDAFLTGAGAIRMQGEDGITLLQFTADHALPEGARLQIDAIGYEAEQ